MLVAVFVGLGFWSGLPLAGRGALAGLLLFARPLPLVTAAPAAARGSGGLGIPSGFWIFAAFAVCYGVVETMNGNWATVYMTQSLGASATVASLALTAFWGMVTVGRILFAAIERWLPGADRVPDPAVRRRRGAGSDRAAAGRTPRRGSLRSGWPASAARRCCR